MSGSGPAVNPDSGSTSPRPRVRIPPGWDLVITELAGIVTATLRTPTAVGVVLLDLHTRERVLTIDGEKSLRSLRRLLLLLADEHDTAHDMTTAPPGSEVWRTGSPGSWTPMQLLAGATQSTWLPPRPSGSEHRRERYRWLYHYRRINAAILRAGNPPRPSGAPTAAIAARSTRPQAVQSSTDPATRDR